MERCHDSIGRTMYYTSITITLGFLILALSNFIPTIYFDAGGNDREPDPERNLIDDPAPFRNSTILSSW